MRQSSEEIEVMQTTMSQDIVGSSVALRSVLAQVAKVAPTDSTVLITGETGTGKELIARAVHERSRRAHRAFVAVNCSAIPPALIASELFGFEKGAFTGATQRRPGRFELADEGTLFLDEVGELPPETQVSLLRVLQEQQVERLGDSRPISVDVRVLAATNRDLPRAIEAGTFRRDLFYRLNVFPLRVPSLRERADDIPLLVEHFIARFARQAGKQIRTIDKRTLDLFRSSSWPGNVRELQNVVERAVILSDGDTFPVEPDWLTRTAGQSSVASVRAGGRLSQTLAEHQKALIEAALAETRGRVSGPSGAAAKLRINSSTLESQIKVLKIDKHRFRTRAFAAAHPPNND
jgi:formate hydrogenlyase transcriptional activator